MVIENNKEVNQFNEMVLVPKNAANSAGWTE